MSGEPTMRPPTEEEKKVFENLIDAAREFVKTCDEFYPDYLEAIYEPFGRLTDAMLSLDPDDQPAGACEPKGEW